MSMSSSTSLSSMANNNNNNNNYNNENMSESANSPGGMMPSSSSPISQSLPSTFGRKNNHHLQLSTILDYDTDPVTGNILSNGGGDGRVGSNNNNNNQSSSANASPTLINSNMLQAQQSVSSSRESSPGIQLKPHHRHSSSRDASPSLVYRNL